MRLALGLASTASLSVYAVPLKAQATTVDAATLTRIDSLVGQVPSKH